MSWRVRSLAWAFVATSIVAFVSCGGSRRGAIRYPTGIATSVPPFATPTLFAANSVWNAPLSPGAPIDPSSPAMVKKLVEEVDEEQRSLYGPYIETASDSTSIYRVPANQPPVHVKLNEATVWWRISLQAAFGAVPIPPGARPAAGNDAHMTIWQPSTDRLWEFFHARKLADGWHAAWGGAIEHVSQSPGYYTDHSWPGAHSYWGSTASSLPVAAGTITIEELQHGSIDHALAIDMPFARKDLYASPAQRTDGSSADSYSLPEGAHLRIDPSLNIASLHLPPVVQTMAIAAQRYGMIVRDQTGHAVGFFAEDPTPTGANPYPALFGYAEPTELLAGFPWRHVEVIRMDAHQGSGPTTR